MAHLPACARSFRFRAAHPRAATSSSGSAGTGWSSIPAPATPQPDATPEVEIGRLPAGKTTHLLIAYQVGRLVAYLDGEAVLETDAIQGGFYHWKPRPLLFGDGPRGGASWAGTLEGVAIYSRFLDAEEAHENYIRYRRKLAARPTVPRLVVDATLHARSATPSLADITPYREALAVFEYRLERVVEGSVPQGAIARRPLDDPRRQATRKPGHTWDRRQRSA